MKIQFNWGTGIFIAYTLFALALFTAVYASTKHDHSLVVEDYYAKDIAYQQQLDKLNNAANLQVPMDITLIKAEGQIKLTFPPNIKTVSGEVSLYRPSNKALDMALPIRTDAENTMLIDISGLQAGQWKLKTDWTGDGVAFFNEEILFW